MLAKRALFDYTKNGVKLALFPMKNVPFLAVYGIESSHNAPHHPDNETFHYFLCPFFRSSLRRRTGFPLGRNLPMTRGADDRIAQN